jgi:hypothetical protein
MTGPAGGIELDELRQQLRRLRAVLDRGDAGALAACLPALDRPVAPAAPSPAGQGLDPGWLDLIDELERLLARLRAERDRLGGELRATGLGRRLGAAYRPGQGS